MISLARLFHNPDGGLDRWLLFVFLMVNGLVLFNAVAHDPRIQYDGPAHLAYISTLASLRLPTPEDSYEFFSPPLPYILPAIANSLGLSLWWAAKFGQIVNVALSIGITITLIALCRLAKPTDGRLALVALMCLGALPVYYKTMAFVRGEPYIAFLTLAGIALTTRAATSSRRSLANLVLPGACWGLLALSRQWGVLSAAGLLAGLAISALRELNLYKMGMALAGVIVALVIGGWFYIQGDPFAFNQPPHPWALSQFYTWTGNGHLFTDPIRPSFPNQAAPIFYAETWGDYWCYFSVYGRDPVSGHYLNGIDLQNAVAASPLAIETNRFTINSYLGRVNLLGLLPTALAVLAFGAAVVRLSALLRAPTPLTPAEVIPVMVVFVISASAIGYLWFLGHYPDPGKSDTVKASYMLQVFAPLALLTADFVRRLRLPMAAWVFGWALLMIHNLPAMTTNFIIY